MAQYVICRQSDVKGARSDALPKLSTVPLNRLVLMNRWRQNNNSAVSARTNLAFLTGNVCRFCVMQWKIEGKIWPIWNVYKDVLFNCPAQGETRGESKRRKLRVISLLRKHELPHLWSTVSDQVLEDGELNVSVITLSVQNVEDLTYLITSGNATNISKLEWVPHWLST